MGSHWSRAHCKLYIKVTAERDRWWPKYRHLRNRCLQRPNNPLYLYNYLADSSNGYTKDRHMHNISRFFKAITTYYIPSVFKTHIRRGGTLIIRLNKRTYPYKNAAPAIPPPHWAMMNITVRRNEIFFVTPIATVTAGFTCAPTTFLKWK